jgi:hypothetical protein
MDKLIKTTIKKLIEKTNNKQVIWHKTGECNFYLRLSEWVIIIRSYEPFPNRYNYQIALISNDGNDIYRIIPDKRERRTLHNLLEELYLSAMGTYHNTEEQCKRILEEIRNSDIIGYEPKDDILESQGSK